MTRDPNSKREDRFGRFREKAHSRPLATLLVANIIPIVVVVALAISYHNGSIQLVPDVENVLPSLIALGLSLAVLVFLAWVVAPLIMPAAKSASRYIDDQSRRIAKGGIFTLVARLPLLLGGIVLNAVMRLNMVVLVLLVIVDVLAIVASVVIFAIEVWSVGG